MFYINVVMCVCVFLYFQLKPQNIGDASPAVTAATSAQTPSRPSTSIINSPPSSSHSSDDDSVSMASSASALNRKFKIPDTWRPAIMDCIKQASDGDQLSCLTPSIRNQIVRILVDQMHMFAFDPKPKKQFATDVAQQLIKKYPFLKESGQCVSGYVSLSMCIVCLHYCTYAKKMLEHIHNVVAGKRKRQTSTDKDAPVAKRGRPKQVAKTTRYPPLSDTGDGDDDITIQRNVEKLRKELAEKNPKKETVLALARQTFSFRRKHVLSEDSLVSATQLLEKFAELNKVYIVSKTACVSIHAQL